MDFVLLYNFFCGVCVYIIIVLYSTTDCMCVCMWCVVVVEGRGLNDENDE